ncbi:uncharacterized protein EI90DRAFT_2050930 [Cantharellus anzutake]|uniref:uncharacterized protein n=1 Tax=Cantharellus anzutake TaxID=1750568 RepID=UPI001908715F|nr:uncharacterized protein EI90DRAFT_2050930 [Cantharellus anzutake]KAF8340342.1 hypothetical protein EI90DRAFT_2050930 [Cantharellus anzutake]
MHYKIIVTAGPSLDESTHEIVHVNSETKLLLDSEHFNGELTVRVARFDGPAPHGKDPIPNLHTSRRFPMQHGALKLLGGILPKS